MTLDRDTRLALACGIDYDDVVVALHERKKALTRKGMAKCRANDPKAREKNRKHNAALRARKKAERGQVPA
jgi:hypothetical protein